MPLSRLYHQVTELQVSRFGADYDLEKGLERYRPWLRDHTEEPAPQDAAELAATDAVLPDAFPVSGTARAEWDGDRAVTEMYSLHYRA